MRWAGAKLALIRPYQLIAADVGIEVSSEGKLILAIYNFLPQNITRNAASREAYAKDPLIKKMGSLKGLDDMLSGVSAKFAPPKVVLTVSTGREIVGGRLEEMANGSSFIYGHRNGRSGHALLTIVSIASDSFESVGNELQGSGRIL